MHRIAIMAVAALLLGGCTAGSLPKPPVAKAEAKAAPAPANEPAKDFWYWTAMGSRKIANREWQGVIEAAQKAIALDAKHHAGWYLMGRALLESWHPDGAVTALERASELTGGGNAEIELSLGKALEASGQLVKAATVYQKAVDRLPPNAALNQALADLKPRLTGSSPRLTAAADVLKRYKEQPDPLLLSSVITALEDLLASPEALSVPGSTDTRLAEFRFPGDAQDGVHVITFNAAPKGSTQALWYSWIQWWEHGQVRIQRLNAGEPWAVARWALLPGPDPRRLLIERKWADGPGAHAVTLYALVGQGDNWMPAESGLGALPSTVGKSPIQVGSAEVTVSGQSSDAATLSVEDGGQKLVICDPSLSPAPCATATWNGTKYEVK